MRNIALPARNWHLASAWIGEFSSPKWQESSYDEMRWLKTSLTPRENRRGRGAGVCNAAVWPNAGSNHFCRRFLHFPSLFSEQRGGDSLSLEHSPHCRAFRRPLRWWITPIFSNLGWWVSRRVNTRLKKKEMPVSMSIVLRVQSPSFYHDIVEYPCTSITRITRDS